MILRILFMLIHPSDRQFRRIRGFWNKWLWKDKAYDGSPAPTGSEWLKDILRICEVLSNECINTKLFLDYDHKDYLKEYSIPNRCDIHPVDLPESLPKIGYVRDQSITILQEPVMCNMAIDLRRREEEVIVELYHRIGKTPIARPRWECVDGKLVRANIEGGNIFLIKAGRGEYLLLSGIGIRGTNHAAVKFLSKLLPENVKIILLPIVSYIRNWESGAVHLDVAFTYLGDIKGNKLCIVDSSRVAIYSALEYDRERDSFKIIELLRLFKKYDILIDEPPVENCYSESTMLNMLNLGNGKIIADAYSRKINR